jgi:hypothetical protein
MEEKRHDYHRELKGTGGVTGFLWERLGFEVDFNNCGRIYFIDFCLPSNQLQG